MDYPVNGIYYKDRNSSFVELRVNKKITDTVAYHKLFESLALIALFYEKGVYARAISAIGGYHMTIEDSAYKSVSHNKYIRSIIRLLGKCKDPFQIQAGFTLSRAYAQLDDPEISIYEFFKVVELYIKHQGFTCKLSQISKRDIDNYNLFTPSIKKDLYSNRDITSETVDLIWIMKDIRNKFIGHGGVRPYIAKHYGDPENSYSKLASLIRQYNPGLVQDERFYENLSFDLAVLARLLFCKMCEVPPIHLQVPGCWWQPSGQILAMVQLESMDCLMIDYDILKPTGH